MDDRNWGRVREVMEWTLAALRAVYGTPQGKVTAILLWAGIGLVSGSWWQGAVSSIYLHFVGSPLDVPDPPPATGWILIAIGLLFPVWGMIREGRRATHARPPTVIAIRHQSMEALTAAVTASDLPGRLAGAEVRMLELDQSALFADGRLTSPEAAVQLQARVAADLRALLANTPAAEVAYGGKAHIPLAFLAGHQVSTGIPVHLLELERHGGGWWRLEEGREGADLGIAVTEGGNRDAAEAVIRISVSYPVSERDVLEACPFAHRDFHISVAEPMVDAITTVAQVAEVSKAFRTILDDFRKAPAAPHRVHVFYSGPMGLAFSLGRQVSKTIHPPVFVYNFTARTTPKYAWGIEVNGSGPCEGMVVRPEAAIA